MAKDSLGKAIKLHEVHMTKPKTATAKSQEKMMGLLKGHTKEMAPRKTSKK